MFSSLFPPAGTRIVIAATSQYAYVLPHPALRRHIAHYTVSRPDGTSGPPNLCIVPDASGCIVCSRYDNRLETLFWGPTSRCVDLENDVNRTPLRIFVEFLPCGAHAFLRGLPLAETRDARLSLNMLDPLLDGVIRQTFAEASPASVLDGFDALFLARLKQDHDSPLMRVLARQVTLTGGKARVRELSGLTGYSERHMNRICLERLGLGLKSFARVVRINRAVALLQRDGFSLTSLAQDLGYYDQAHFIHDFRTVCGVSPSHYARHASDFYNEEYK